MNRRRMLIALAVAPLFVLSLTTPSVAALGHPFGLSTRDRVAAASDPAVIRAGTTLDNELNTVQNELYQTKMGAGEDAANYGTNLNEKIAGLHTVIGSVDGRPTGQTGQVFSELNAQLQTQRTNLRTDMGTDVPSFNRLVQQHGLAPTSCTAVQIPNTASKGVGR